MLGIACVGSSNADSLEGEQIHRDLGEVIGNADVGAGSVLCGVVCVLSGDRASEPASGADKAAGDNGAAVCAVDDHLLPELAEVALFGGEETGTHLNTVSTHCKSSSEGLAVAEAAGAADESVLIGELLDDVGQEGHGVDRLPCSVHAAFVTGSDEDLNTGLLAAGSGADAGEDVHPDHALLLDEVCPRHGVAGGGDENAEAALHLGIGFTQFLYCLHDLHCVCLDLGRNHNVCTENTIGFLGLFENAGEHLLEDGDIVIGGLGMSLLAEVLKNNGVGLTGGGCEGAAQAKAAGVGCSDAEAGHRVGTHTGLDDGVLDADKFSKSGLDHDNKLLLKKLLWECMFIL